jgi:hypothetical protein
MSETIFERDEYEQNEDGIYSPEDSLTEDSMDQVLEQGYSPNEKPRALDAFGTTLAEEKQGETLDQRLAQEEPDPAMEVDPLDGDPGARVGEAGVDADLEIDSSIDVLDDGEVGDARAGRLVDPDQGAGTDLEKDMIGTDVGIDGAAASAEEAAMHVVDLEESDAAIERDADGRRPTLGTS